MNRRFGKGGGGRKGGAKRGLEEETEERSKEFAPPKRNVAVYLSELNVELSKC